jgi:hypothetical protein
MDNTIYEYIKNGITINGDPVGGYQVFTIPTQHFKIDSLHQLTPETFENAIQKQKEYERMSSELMSEVFKEVQNKIDEDILNQLRGGEPNPDIVPMDTIDRLYKNYLIEDAKILSNMSKEEMIKFGYNLSKAEFIDKLLFDDEFYQKWGEDCCEELTYEERYKIWFSNNYETGMEYNPVYTPPTEPDWDNEYYEPTPKRKLKWN